MIAQALNRNSRKFLLLVLLWFIPALSAFAGTPTVTYIYTDPQGTPLAETDAQGNVTATFDYRPYGSQALGTPPKGPGYTGHVNDSDTGLVYMQARYYDPTAGRFLSVDPVGPVPGSGSNFNRYVYASNNPVVNSDPDGRSPERSDEERARMNDWDGLGNQTFWHDAHSSTSLDTNSGDTSTTLPTVTVTASIGGGSAGSGAKAGIPPDAVLYKTGGGRLFYAPKRADFHKVFLDGEISPGNPIAIAVSLWHYGIFDYQRDLSTGKFIEAYRDAANYAVGLYMYGQGYSKNQATGIASFMAHISSSKNAGSPRQVEWQSIGYDDAVSGKIAEPVK